MIFNHSHSTGAAVGKNRIIKTTPGKLYRLSGVNTGADCYVQVFDAAALPSANANPIFETLAQGAFIYDLDFGELGLPCTTGIVVVASTTANQYVAIAGDTVSFNAIYA